MFLARWVQRPAGHKLKKDQALVKVLNHQKQSHKCKYLWGHSVTEVTKLVQHKTGSGDTLESTCSAWICSTTLFHQVTVMQEVRKVVSDLLIFQENLKVWIFKLMLSIFIKLKKRTNKNYILAILSSKVAICDLCSRKKNNYTM